MGCCLAATIDSHPAQADGYSIATKGSKLLS